MRLIHISDLHFSNHAHTLDTGYWIDNQSSRLKSDIICDFMVRNSASLKSNIVVITGDITDSGDPEDYDIAKSFIGKLSSAGFNVYSIPGNHDYCFEGVLAEYSKDREDRFREQIAPCSYPHEVPIPGGWLILLDSMRGEIDEPGRDLLAQGKLGQAQRAQLEKLVAGHQAARDSGSRIVVAVHHSPFEPTGNGAFKDAADFLQTIRGRIDCLLFGHTTPANVLQQWYPDLEKSNRISFINCENLEHSPWSNEAALGGQGIQLCVGQNADGRLEVFYVGTNLNIYHNYQTGNGWSGESALGGQALQIAVGRNRDGRLEIFYVGTNFGIYHNWQTSPNGSWAGEHRLGSAGDTAQQVCVGENQDGRLELFYIGTNFHVYHNYQTSAGGWSGESALGGEARQISVARNRDGRLEIFYVGLDSGIYHNWQTAPNSGWSGECRFGSSGDFALQVFAAQSKARQIELFYVGTDGCIYRNYQNPISGNWSGEERLGGILNRAQQVCAGRNADGRLEAFYVGANYSLYHSWEIYGDEAYPVTVIDFDTMRHELYTTDATVPRQILGALSVPELGSVTAGRGNNDNLQVIGSSKADGLPCLIWQDAATGGWNWYGKLPCNIPLASVVASRGNHDNLQIIGIGKADSLPYLIWQDAATGSWNWYGKLPCNIPLASVVAFRGNHDNLQVIGIGKADGLPYLIWQDAATGSWSWYGKLPCSTPLDSVVAFRGNHDNLQVIGIGKADGLPYLIWQDAATGSWNWYGKLPCDNVSLASVVAARGDHDNLQVIGIGKGGNLPHLIWQDAGTGGWNLYGILLLA